MKHLDTFEKASFILMVGIALIAGIAFTAVIVAFWSSAEVWELVAAIAFSLICLCLPVGAAAYIYTKL